MGLSTNEIIGIVGILAIGMIGGSFVLSGGSTADPINQIPNTGGSDDGGDTIEMGKSATLSLAAYDDTADSATQVGTDFHAWETSDGEFYLGKQSGSSSSRTTYDTTTGKSVKATSFNSQYPYADVVEADIASELEKENINVYEGASTSNLDLTAYDENGDSTTGIGALGSEEQYQFDRMELDLSNSNVGYNAHMIVVGYPDNVSSVNLPGAEEVDVPEVGEETVSSSNEVAFVPSAFDAAESGEPFMTSWDTVETEGLVVEAENSGTGGSDSLEIAVLDRAPFITQDNSLGFGVQDDASDPNNVGVSHVTQSVAVN